MCIAQGGWNRWKHLKKFGPLKMTSPGAGDHFSATVTVPKNAHSIDFVLSNVPEGEGIYDNRGGLDYHLPVEGSEVCALLSKEGIKIGGGEEISRVSYWLQTPPFTNSTVPDVRYKVKKLHFHVSARRWHRKPLRCMRIGYSRHRRVDANTEISFRSLSVIAIQHPKCWTEGIQ